MHLINTLMEPLALRQLCSDETMKQIVGWCKAQRAQQSHANVRWARRYAPQHRTGAGQALPNLHLSIVSKLRLC